MNVAFGKKATQSSTRYGLPASNAVNGEMGDYAATKHENEPWWKVDLGELRVIKNIRFMTNVHYMYNKDLFVETRKDETDNWNLCTKMGKIENEKTEYKCDAQLTKARFLRIRSTKTCILRINEVEILGY